MSVGSGEFLLWEFPLAYWMEQQGYDVSYISNLDTHVGPGRPARAKGWLSVGHDEYWSLSMFETMKRMVAEGLNLAFLSGNSICGVIDIHPSSDGRPGRIIERVGRFGSPRKEEIEKGFPEEALFTKNGPNEATLMGAQSTYPVTGGGDWTCRKPDHWLFAGTGMKEGDGIPGSGRLGVARRARADPGSGGRRQRQDAKPARRGNLYGDDLPRSQRKLRLQRGHDLVGRRAVAASWLRSPRCVHSAPGPRSSRAADHAEFARPDAAKRDRHRVDSEDDPSPRAETVRKPGRVDRHRRHFVQRQDLLDLETRLAQLAFQLAPAIKVNLHSGDSAVVHAPVTQVGPIEKGRPRLRAEPASPLGVT